MRTGDAQAHTSLFVLEYPAAASPASGPDWCVGAPAPPQHVPRAPTDEVRDRILGTWFGSWSSATLLHQLTPPRPRATDTEEETREAAPNAGADRYGRLLEETLMGQDRETLFDASGVRVGALVLPLRPRAPMSATIVAPTPRGSRPDAPSDPP